MRAYGMTRPRTMNLRRVTAWPGGRWLLALALVGCDREPPPSPAKARSTSVQVGSPELPGEVAPKAKPRAAGPVASAEAPPLEAAPEAAPTAWSIAPSFPADAKGPFFHVTSLAAGVYAEPSFEAKKIGYVRNGGRVPVNAQPTSKKNC